MLSEPQRHPAADGHSYEVAYRLPGHDASGLASVEVNGRPLGSRVVVIHASPQAVDLEVDGLRRVYSVHRVVTAGRAEVYVDGPDGATAFTELPRFADPSAVPRGGSLLAPMPGLVVRVLAETGAAVTAGQPLVVLEAMKMEHTVAAPSDGVLAELRAAAGEQVEAGQLLAVVTPLVPPERSPTALSGPERSPTPLSGPERSPTASPQEA